MSDEVSYFVPGYGISRHIMFHHIRFYLGPDADCRPYQFRGREGFLVTAPLILTRVSHRIFLLSLLTDTIFSWPPLRSGLQPPRRSWRTRRSVHASSGAALPSKMGTPSLIGSFPRTFRTHPCSTLSWGTFTSPHLPLFEWRPGP